MLSEADIKQISARGISEEKVQKQLRQIEQGFPFLKLEAAASVERGIRVLDGEERERLIDDWNEYKAHGHKVVKFVPASGAASRMFKNLFAFLEAD